MSGGLGGRPRLLDAFSGAGGSARGYQLAGFHVTGVDIRPQPHYIGDAFIQGDALAFIEEQPPGWVKGIYFGKPMALVPVVTVTKYEIQEHTS